MSIELPHVGFIVENMFLKDVLVSDVAPLCATDIASCMVSYISSNVNGLDHSSAADVALEDPKVQ